MREAEDKEPISGGTVYFAPPDYHLLVETDKRLSLSDDEPVLFRVPRSTSCSRAPRTLMVRGLIGVVLTGANRMARKA